MEALKNNHKKIITLKLAKKILIFLIFVLVFEFFLFPAPALAAEPIAELENEEIILEDLVVDQEEFASRLPENEAWEVKSYNYHTITAYSSDVYQCDSSPCITANGFNLCEHGVEDSVAANWLVFGTKIRIPEVFGDQVFVVRDRMNSRYTSRVDIWMKDKQAAKKFGLKVAKIEVLE